MHHFCTKSISDCSNLQSSADFITSAKSRNSEKNWGHTSSIKISKNRGPKVEPCGSPDSMRKAEDEFPEVRTSANLDE
jgi:hypothetical protein